MSHPFRRLAALVLGIAIISSCDDGSSVSRFGSGISGGPTGTEPIVPPAPGSADSFPPFVRINLPVAAPIQLINIGDSILVEARVTDDRALKEVSFTGFKEVGDPDLGTFQRIQRYPTIRVPVGAADFRPGLTDTTVRRYLQPAQPIDTTIDSLVIEAVVIDVAGNTFSTRRIVNLVTGPTVTITNPAPSDSFPRGQTFTVTIEASHTTGVDSLITTVTGETSWPTQLSLIDLHKFPSGTKSGTRTITVLIPADAPLRGRITIAVRAVDVNRNPGSTAPIVVFVRQPGTLAPRVSQIVPPKLEISDSITVTADGDGISTVGFVMLDSTGAEFKRYSEPIASPTSNVIRRLPLNMALRDQGQRFSIYSFAIDNNTPPLTGYSRRFTNLAPVTSEAAAWRDTTLITHGRTFALPRDGIVGDVEIDPLGNVFVSNTQFNLLEVWQNPTGSFAPDGIRVGSLPWGLFLTANPDTLLVANSGATTISRVFVGTNTPTAMAEDLSSRIRTRENVIYQVVLRIDGVSGVIRLEKAGEIAYSDRPQYVAESRGGRIYYSTRPTDAATPGTIRWLQPNLPFPDPQQILSYGTTVTGVDIVYSIFHADSIAISRNNATSGSSGSDTLYIFDHVYGQIGPDFAVFDSLPPDAGAKARALGSDVQVLLNFFVPSLALTDTTFVAASGDRQWIAFGEGNTASGPGRIMMINDPALAPAPGFFSPSITVRDLVHNASERVFGLAIDSTGLQVTSHGLQTYMAAVDQPFHLRLEGVYDSFDNGAGVAYHPRARSTLTNVDFRVSFSATDNGVIEIIDVAHYNNRGRLVTKGDLYGPLRVTGPLPGDNPAPLNCAAGTRAGDDPDCVVLKIFGVSRNGLVVINVQWKDIRAQ